MLEDLTQDERDFVDELLFADLTLPAMQFVKGVTSSPLKEVIKAVYARKGELGVDFSAQTLARVRAFARLNNVSGEIHLVEGSWDGDEDWFIGLCAITKEPSSRRAKYTAHGLCSIRGHRDQVQRAVALGEDLAQYAGTTFYLTSVEVDDGKRWWDTQQDTMR